MSLFRIRSASIGCLALILVLAIAPVFTAGPKFYPDDPLQREPESRDASSAKPSDIGLIYEIAMNLFAVPHHKPSNTRAHNANTVDEVPDSSWFTNRAGYRTLRAAEVAIGPDTTEGPAAGVWTVTSSKSDGVTPGFTIRDELNQRPYLGGTLGMALDWPDTGGSQFFITHSPQPHLDARYTAFGRVIKGMEVVDKIEQLDVIRRVLIWDGENLK